MLLELGLPVAASWLAKDLVNNNHPNFLGCTGVYGNRAANIAFSTADQILAIGNRLSIWNVPEQGFDHKPEVIAVDVQVPPANATIFHYDISYVLRQVLEPANRPVWLHLCQGWNKSFPWLEPGTHEDTATHINSYHFTEALQRWFAPDEVVVTDMGSPLMSAFQVLRPKPPQRLITSGGLGEMGCALPLAIGAAFAGAKHILCLHADGGMMLNLQELQTIAHHKLPIKIIVYDNEGYLMIKHTQRMGNMGRSGVDAASGVSFPDYRSLARVFGIKTGELRTWDDFQALIPQFFAAQEPFILTYHMDPEQPLLPRLMTLPDGTRPRFDQMSPLHAN